MCLCCGNREGYDIDDANFGKSYNESFSTSQTAEVGPPIVIISQPTNGAVTATEPSAAPTDSR